MTSNNKIPKILHQIWIGNKPMPEKYLKYQESWKRFNPDWKFVLWNNENIKELKFFSQRAYDNCINWAEKADYLRIVILVEFGGIYADVDVECLKPMDQLIEKYEFVVGFEDSKKLCNAVILSKKNHQILEKMIIIIMHKLEQKSKKHDLGKIGVDFFSKFLLEQDKNLYKKIIFLNSSCFYPIHWKDIKSNINTLILKESFCIHYYDASWSTIFMKTIRKINSINFFNKITTKHYKISKTIYIFLKKMNSLFT